MKISKSNLCTTYDQYHNYNILYLDQMPSVERKSPASNICHTICQKPTTAIIKYFHDIASNSTDYPTTW